MTDCPRVGKLFGGCKFSPRYDTVSATAPDGDVAFWSPGQRPPKPTPARKTYLCDVCSTCGKTLFRRKEMAAKPSTTEPLTRSGMTPNPPTPTPGIQDND